MVAAFNTAFTDAGRRYPSCSSDAQLQARRLAQEGETLARLLSHGL